MGAGPLPCNLTPDLANMTSQTVGLRVSSIIFGLVSLGHVARLWAQTEIVIGGHHLGRIPSVITIIITGGLAIWLAKLAGPWCSETNGAPNPKI